MKLCRNAAFLKNDGLYSLEGIISAPIILTDGLRDLIVGSTEGKWDWTPGRPLIRPSSSKLIRF